MGLSCFFPTTLVVVDDDPAFLAFLRMSLAAEPFLCRTFLNTLDALDFINGSSYGNTTLDYFVNGADQNITPTGINPYDIGTLYKEIYSSSRFRTISVVISDYRMPKMNGVEFCSKILDKRIQRILLTGLANDKVAIDAFNAGHISQFAKKSFSLDILSFVNKSAYKYFETGYPYNFSSLNDPIFFEFLMRIFKGGNFVEGYMLDTFGSYLFMKANGEGKILNVLTNSEISELIEIAEKSDEIDAEVLEKIRSRKYMLVYDHSNIPQVSDWGNFLRPARVLEAVQTRYYYLADLNEENGVVRIDTNKVVPFDAFKRKIKKEKDLDLSSQKRP